DDSGGKVYMYVQLKGAAGKNHDPANEKAFSDDFDVIPLANDNDRSENGSSFVICPSQEDLGCIDIKRAAVPSG
ncbi:hypothetical protein FRB90_000325, partial [Tulasnella sp. 427]